MTEREQEALSREELVDLARAAIDALPALRRGVLGNTPLLVAIAVSVAVFDAAIVRQIMESTSGGEVVRWFITIGIPLVIVAINHVTGLLVGSFARGVTRRRLRVWGGIAVGAMFAGIFAFALLIAIFRAQAYAGSNVSLEALAQGTLNINPQINVDVSGLISPWWMAPLQVVASGAAVSASALRTLGEEGRELREQVRERRRELVEARAALAQARADVDLAAARLGRCDELAGELKAEGAQAARDMEQLDAQLETRAGAFSELAESAVALLQSEYLIARTRPQGTSFLHPFANPALAAVAMVATGAVAALLGASALVVAIAAPFAGLLLDTILRARNGAPPFAAPPAPVEEAA